jgi:hypothetical protein
MFAVNVLKPVTPVPSELANEPAPWAFKSVTKVLLLKNEATLVVEFGVIPAI